MTLLPVLLHSKNQLKLMLLPTDKVITAFTLVFGNDSRNCRHLTPKSNVLFNNSSVFGFISIIAFNKFHQTLPIFPLPSNIFHHLRSITVNHSRKWNRFSQMIKSANPAYSSFQTNSKTCMRNSSISSQIKIPLEHFLWKIVFFNSF